MSALLLLLAVLGRPATVDGELGACQGVVVAVGAVLVDAGACALDSGVVWTCASDVPSDPYAGCEEATGPVTGAHKLPSGRVLVTFSVWED